MKLDQNVTLSLIEQLHYLINSWNALQSNSSILIKQYIITETEWKYNASEDYYTYNINHNFNSTMLITDAIDVSTEMSISMPYKIIDNNNLQLISTDNKAYRFNVAVNVLKGD